MIPELVYTSLTDMMKRDLQSRFIFTVIAGTEYINLIDLLEGTHVSNGELFTFNGGRLHSVGVIPAKLLTDGSKQWYCHGELHSNFGPTEMLMDGTRRWYIDGKLHHSYGAPAELLPDGI